MRLLTGHTAPNPALLGRPAPTLAARLSIAALASAGLLVACSDSPPDARGGPDRESGGPAPALSGRAAEGDASTDTLGDAGAPDTGDPGPADASADAPAASSRFECKTQGPSAWRPYWVQALGGGAFKDWGTTPKGLLGQNAMTTQKECDDARAAANAEHGVICSRTGLDGWKPTLYTGTSPGRADFGYLGGSTIARFEDCLKATRASSARGVCYWGGSAWYVSPIDRSGTAAGPFATIDACTAQTRAP